MSAACRWGDRSEERHVKARKEYRCEWCGKPILAGSDHVVATEFPGGDAGYATAAGHPVRMRIHGEAPCHYHGDVCVCGHAKSEHATHTSAPWCLIKGGCDCHEYEAR